MATIAWLCKGKNVFNVQRLNVCLHNLYYCIWMHLWHLLFYTNHAWLKVLCYFIFKCWTFTNPPACKITTQCVSVMHLSVMLIKIHDGELWHPEETGVHVNVSPSLQQILCIISRQYNDGYHLVQCAWMVCCIEGETLVNLANNHKFINFI